MQAVARRVGVPGNLPRGVDALACTSATQGPKISHGPPAVQESVLSTRRSIGIPCNLTGSVDALAYTAGATQGSEVGDGVRRLS